MLLPSFLEHVGSQLREMTAPSRPCHAVLRLLRRSSKRRSHLTHRGIVNVVIPRLACWILRTSGRTPACLDSFKESAYNPSAWTLDQYSGALGSGRLGRCRMSWMHLFDSVASVA